MNHEKSSKPDRVLPYYSEIRAICAERNLRSEHRLLLFVIRSYMRAGSPWCRPRISDLARDTGFSAGSVHNYTKELKRMGLIRTEVKVLRGSEWEGEWRADPQWRGGYHLPWKSGGHNRKRYCFVYPWKATRDCTLSG